MPEGLRVPSRVEDDEDLLAAAASAVKKPRLLSATAPAPAAAAPRPAQRKLNTAAAVGGVDTGVEGGGAAAPAAAVAPAAAAPPLVDFRASEWYYLDAAGKYCGPLTADDMKERYEAEDAPPGEALTSATFVWSKGVIADWRPIEQITELYEYLEDADAVRGGATKPPGAAKAGDGAAPPGKGKGKKRSRGAMEGGEPKPEGWFELKVNTSVYVSGLPDGATPEDLENFFKKVGIIKTDPVTRKPRVKVYKHNDGLVTFMKKESVDLAVKLLDGARFSDKAMTAIKVQPAKFEKKEEGEFKKRDMKAFEEAAKKEKKNAAGKLGWADGESDPNERTMILKNVFQPEEAATEVNLFAMVKGDMTEECAKHGGIDRMRIFKESKDGVVMVRFKSFIAAESCIKQMEGRWYRQRQLHAYLWDRKERFEKAEDEGNAKRTFGVGNKYGDSDSEEEK